VEIYSLKEHLNKTTNSTVFAAHREFTIRAEEPQQFGKFGAQAQTGGPDMLWISSGWADDENGVVWSFNVTEHLSKPRHKLQIQLPLKTLSEDPKDNYQIATVFARGKEPKVLTLLTTLLMTGPFWRLAPCRRHEW
jgi:hypothetical protein